MFQALDDFVYTMIKSINPVTEMVTADPTKVRYFSESSSSTVLEEKDEAFEPQHHSVGSSNGLEDTEEALQEAQEEEVDSGDTLTACLQVLSAFFLMFNSW
jgi:hypothetical protein